MAKTDEQAQQSARGAQSAPRAETTLGYEQARDELVEVVRRLEAGGTSLEESLALWERGEELAKVCRRWLEGARARLDAALVDETDEDEDGAGDGDGGGVEGAERATEG
ncbi:exodeoxyribonuclease VII small subunit [Streptomyces sp. NPDC056669]|uniref:exodeoxyribonuclease VII small subunit n=1 Tax=Streptomyces sp. NPDC056669 TaxID=3345903 RepID=UPI0036BA50EC